MYLYLYDSFLSNKKHAGTLARVETRLTDMGIGGKIVRLSPLRNMQNLLADEIGSGVKTIVVVGNDKTVSEVVNVMAGFDVALGIIPVGPDNGIAQTLGIPEGEDACMTLAARIIQKIDLGKINNTFFLSAVQLSDSNVTIECERRYTITPQPAHTSVTIYNLRPISRGNGNPQDGLLEIVVEHTPPKLFGLFSRGKVPSQSVIPCSQAIIRSK
jgi:hypothetical protein